MSLSGSLRTAMTFGLGLLLAGAAGCAEEPSAGVSGAEVAPPADGLGVLVNDPAGTGGTNALNNVEFLTNQGTLWMATQMPLYLDAGKGLFNQELFGIFSGVAGESTFRYAMQCALPRGRSISQCEGEPCGGNGILKDASVHWLSGVLEEKERLELFACMAAHVNSFGAQVPIWLTGEAVSTQDGVNSQFDFQEAYWAAHYESPSADGAASATTGALVYDVWPLPDLIDGCGSYIASDSLELRVCGDKPELCDFKGHDYAECVEGETGATCNGKPVIKTWLKASDAKKLHPNCRLLPTPPPPPQRQ